MDKLENIRMDIGCNDGDAIEEARRKLGKSPGSFGKIYKKSIDARHKKNIKFVYSVVFDDDGDDAADDDFDFKMGQIPQKTRPIVVGFGPAGMFCALVLARRGYRPVVFEMGADIDERAKKVDALFRSGVIDEKTNVCYGEGGAGAFSDGKLTTRINDPLCRFVLNSFVKFGADGNIIYQAKPHIGTDMIRAVAKNIRREIKRFGGEIYFNAEVTDIGCGEVTVNNSEKHNSESVFLAAGNSAFGMYDLLLGKGFAVEPKAYSVGLRIEHEQNYIDELVYGNYAGHKNLPPAEYAISHKKPDMRGVYTFCMCPGGVVVNCSTENGGIVTNGMSYSDRAEKNANAAIAVSVLPEDYGKTARGAFDFRKRLEEAAFNIKNRFAAPAQTLGDYMKNGVGSLEKSAVKPSFTGEVTEYDLNKIFPEFINAGIKIGIENFDKKLRGYFFEDAVLTAPETRTSSAVRILRDNETLQAAGHGGIAVYPCGEGSGYAGGIMSSAVDGLRCAAKYMEKWKSE